MVRAAKAGLGDVAIIMTRDKHLHAAVCSRDDGAAFVTVAAPGGLFGIRDAHVVRAWTFE